MTDKDVKPEPRQPFGRIPANLDITDLDCGERGVVIVLAQHVRRKTSDSSSPGVATIASHTGLTRRGVQYAIRRLESKGILRIDRRGGRGVPNRYTLLVKGEPQSALITPTKGATQSAPINPVKGEPQSAPYDGIKGAISGHKGRTLECTRMIEVNDRKKKRPAQRATAENIQGGKQKQPTDCELLNALRDRGVSEPMRTRLAEDPDLTVQVLNSVQGSGGGLVINIRDTLYQIAECRARNEARNQREEAELKESRQHSREVEALVQAAEAVLARHTDQQQAEAFGIMVSAPMPHQVRSWLLCSVPPGELVIHLDPEGFELERRKLLGLPDLPPEEPQTSMFPGKMLRD